MPNHGFPCRGTKRPLALEDQYMPPPSQSSMGSAAERVDIFYIAETQGFIDASFGVVSFACFIKNFSQTLFKDPIRFGSFALPSLPIWAL